MTSLIDNERLVYWYPAIVTGVVMNTLFITLGQTPILRATALAIVLMGITLSLRRLGALLSITGGLALGLSPVYWSQTLPVPTTNTWLVIGLIVLGIAIGLPALLAYKRVFISAAIGVSLFVVLYVVFGLGDRSLRLTTLLAAWLIYILIIALRQTNPRPDEPPPTDLSQRHTLGILLMLALGIFNDPLFTLFMPAVIMGLWLSHTALPRWYWSAILLLLLWGGYGITQAYMSPEWTFTHADTITQQAIPYIVLDGWRYPIRWVDLVQYITQQFTWVGAILGVIGIARMARWYPTLGIVLMILYATYALLSLTYFGRDVAILLLPLLMIQVITMTYAVYSIGEWVRHAGRSGHWLRYGVYLAYLALPISTFFRTLTP